MTSKPTAQEKQSIAKLKGYPVFQDVVAYLRRLERIAQSNLLTAEGNELHRLQGDARTLKEILAQTDGADGDGVAERQGRS